MGDTQQVNPSLTPYNRPPEAEPQSRSVSDKIVNTQPQFPVSGITKVEGDLRDRTFVKDEQTHDGVGKAWRPKGRS